MAQAYVTMRRISQARREIEQRKLPFLIRRQLPNGESEYWSTRELEVMWLAPEERETEVSHTLETEA